MCPQCVPNVSLNPCCCCMVHCSSTISSDSTSIFTPSPSIFWHLCPSTSGPHSLAPETALAAKPSKTGQVTLAAKLAENDKVKVRLFMERWWCEFMLCVCVCVCVCVLVNHIKTSSDILTHTTHNNQRVSFVQEIFDHLSQGLIFYFSTFLLYLVHLNPN